MTPNSLVESKIWEVLIMANSEVNQTLLVMICQVNYSVASKRYIHKIGIVYYCLLVSNHGELNHFTGEY